VPALVDVVVLRVDVQVHSTAGQGREAILDGRQVTGHQGEQVRRLGMRVPPHGAVICTVLVQHLCQVAVREQHREARTVGDDGSGIGGQDIRAVGEVGDATEPLGLALGAEVAAGQIEPGQLGVALGLDQGFDVEDELAPRRRDRQRGLGEHIGVGCQLPAVKDHASQLQILAVEPDRPPVPAVAATTQYGPHGRPGRIEPEGQVHVVDQEIRWPVVFEANGCAFFGGGGIHGAGFPVAKSG
jgi:hypothetical protein